MVITNHIIKPLGGSTMKNFIKIIIVIGLIFVINQQFYTKETTNKAFVHTIYNSILKNGGAR